jgi:hypothetical protein
LVFLPSEATTVGLSFWAARRFFDRGELPVTTGLAEALAWCAIIGLTAGVGRRCLRRPAGLFTLLTFALGIVTVVWTAVAADHFTWSEGVAAGAVLACALVILRRLLSISLSGSEAGAAEGVRWAILQGAAAFALHPYVRASLVGAGDAFNYGLTLADFSGQLHAGVFPIFVGQTPYAFNGNIHPLRTAPLFSHVGGLLDLLTMHSLPPYILLNLAIVGSAGLAATGAYAALRVYSRRLPWVALALAVLYLLTPAFLAPLYEGDMIATFMAFPIVPWLALGLALAAERPGTFQPWLIQGVALAALWWAHPAIAFWAALLCLGAGAASVAGAGITASWLAPLLAAGVVFAFLGVYEIVSVLTLKLPPGPESQAEQAWTVMGNIRHYWATALRPLSQGGDSLLGDIQLGYSLLLCAVGGLFVRGARKAARVLFICMLGIFLLLLPVPGATRWLWSHVPHAALDVTNAWPMQRLYPLMSGVAMLAAWAGLSELRLRGRLGQAMLVLLLLGCCAWSTAESQKLFHHSRLMRSSRERSAILYSPGNIALTRVSYMFFGHAPSYFSDGPMQPELETRLLDARTHEILGDAASRRDEASHPAGQAEMRGAGNGIARLEIPMRPWETAVVRFDFLGRLPEGEMQVASRSMYGLYRLPSGGGPRSFGAGSESSRALEIRNDSEAGDTVAVTFVPNPSTGETIAFDALFARVGVEPLEPGSHPIELVSLLPFQAIVHANTEAILETPKMDIPGYRASVNGRLVETTQTADGLVGVPVLKGTSQVRLEYRGPAVLRWTYAISGLSWLAVMATALAAPLPVRSQRTRALLSTLEAGARRFLPGGLLAASLGAALVVGLPWTWQRWIAPEGTLRLVVMLPAGNAGQSEPLVETGRIGAADVIYVRFLGDNRISVGYDKWGIGASESAPFEIDPMKPQAIEVEMESLARKGLLRRRRSFPNGVTVAWNGRQVLAVKRTPYPLGSSTVEIGRNPLGATSCSATFTGIILDEAYEEQSHPR